MEPASPQRIKINYSIFTNVQSIRKLGDYYFIRFEGSQESLNFGTDPPEFKVGDKIKITFERIGNDTRRDIQA